MQRSRPDSIVAVGALVVVAALFVPVHAEGQKGPPPALVATAPAVEELITEKIELPGTVLPVRDSVVASEVEGRVAERAVENGRRVDRADVLVRLDSSRLRQDLAVAEAQLAEVEAFMNQHGFARFSCHEFAVRAQGGSYYDVVYQRVA